MNCLNLLIGEHDIQIKSKSTTLLSFFKKNFHIVEGTNPQPHLVIQLIAGFGTPFVDFTVAVSNDLHGTTYARSDYKIEIASNYECAKVFVHDELALKHALMNVYSSFILHHNWGILLHSSCVIDRGNAHLFAGHSGAGKSTAARLSSPRELLSDEATLLKISNDEVLVFNSPFRSELQSNKVPKSIPLASIQLLHQAPTNRRLKLKQADSLLQLTDKVFYWVYNTDETKNILHLLHFLVRKVPAYRLEFKKDDSFWEMIS